MTLDPDDLPPAAVTRDEFLRWRAPREGTTNPQVLTNPVWTWLARHREVNAYQANAHFAGPKPCGGEPCWCNQRFGQSQTTLADGRVIAIAGEHEDSYDPDFYIYNDVLVTAPSGDVEIYGYPRAVFPPTDFHSATLVGDRIVIVGRLGYHDTRVVGTTPVFALDTQSLAIAPIVTTGELPGWIFGHTAERSADARVLTIRGGSRLEAVDDDTEIRDNIDDWALDLDARVWTRLTARRWPLWQLARASGDRNELFEISMMSYWVAGDSELHRTHRAQSEAKLGGMPDIATYRARYAPPVAHVAIVHVYTDDDAADPDPFTTRIIVDGITVRYVESSGHVRVTIEGDLPEAAVTAIIEDARAKLERVERTPYTARQLRT